MNNLFYYSDDKTTFTSKLNAIKYGSINKQNIYFYYHDSVFDQVNWKINPPGDLNFHYKTQAQKIRDEYDYIILCYSGGYDSTNILETFHYNNIKLDKIVVTGPFKQDQLNNDDTNHNGEIYKNAFPYLKELGLDNITQALDYTEYYGDMNNFSIKEFGDEWIHEIGSRYSPHHFFWRDLEKFVVPKEYQHKKIGIIWGTEKPMYRDVRGKMGFAFVDAVTNGYGRWNQKLLYNTTNINFYWDPGYPLILIKQLHVLKAYLNMGVPINNNDIKIANIIYKLRKPLICKSGKSPTLFVGKRDSFLANMTDSEIYQFYANGMRKLDNYLDRKKEKDSTPFIKSKYYTIE